MDLKGVRDESNKPNLSPFHQQKLKGWQPIINTNNLYLPFFTIGVIFICIGSGLVYNSYQVTDLTVDYTHCYNSDGEKCSNVLYSSNYTSNYKSCHCSLNITVPHRIKGPAYVYYGLSNFFQNHRRYVQSRDDNQLKGLDVNRDLSSDCDPYTYDNNTKIAYAPCGLIANSIFNDTFRLEYILHNSTHTVPWTKDGIAWAADTTVRFGKPANWDNTVKPVNWPEPEQNRSSLAYSGDEELLVWLRSSAMPTFKKLHRIIEAKTEPFLEGLPEGRYILHINYAYPVTAFDGTKSFTISDTNYMGGKNPAMGITYLAVGTIQFSLAIVFLFINAFVARRRQNEAWYIAMQADNNNGCSNETFCHVDAGDNSVFLDQSTSEENRHILR